MAIEIDPHQGPVQARGNLFDMGRLARAVIALDHDPAIMRKACADGQCGLGIKLIGGIDLRHMRIGGRKGRDHHVAINAKRLTHGNHAVWCGKQKGVGGGVDQVCHIYSVIALSAFSKPYGRKNLLCPRVTLGLGLGDQAFKPGHDRGLQGNAVVRPAVICGHMQGLDLLAAPVLDGLGQGVGLTGQAII